MGYSIHIEHIHAEPENRITLNQWLEYIEKDPEMERNDHVLFITPENKVLNIKTEGLTVWKGYSKYPEGIKVYFSPSENSISVKNPDHEVLIKMYKIAQYFKACVRGDDGEIYDENGEEIENTVNRDLKGSQADQNLNRQKWWKFW